MLYINLSGRLINTNNSIGFGSFFVRLTSSSSLFKHSKHTKDDHNSYSKHM